MLKIFIKISVIILLNLFAFLLFGIILGAIFGKTETFLVFSIIFSIIPLIIIMVFEIQKTTKELNNISKIEEDDRK
ncbi:MAG: hypothetical protein PHR68_00250 [Candidatus Gracilibacteria bacterium]|nr:hypothetical protein [Candidatus Gracilibacteria bacterium]